MTWFAILYVLIEIAGIVFAMCAVMWARTSQGATAWAVALIAMPVLALPAFAIFGGRSFQGYVSRRRTSDRRLKKEWEELETYVEAARCYPKRTDPVIDAFERLADQPFVRARSVKLLQDGDQFFPVLKEVLESARETIELQFYTFRDDGIGRELAAILKAKAAQGVKVRMLFDWVGSHETPNAFFEDLRRSGVQALAFQSTRWRWKKPRFQFNFRNHRKLVNVDNRVLLLGGLNVGDEYLSRNPDIGHWRDTAIRIEGTPAVQGRHAFLADWFWSARQVIDFNRDRLEPPTTEGGVPLLVHASSPADPKRGGALPLLNAIHSAERRLWLTTPYFVPDEAVVYGLQLARLRGVDVKLLVTEKTDNQLPQLASYTYYDEMLPYGIEIYRYPDGLMHSKVVLVDDELAYVGSSNIDNRSFYLNFEIGAWIHDAAFAREIETMLQKDIAQSPRLERDVIEGMSFKRRFVSGLARLLAPAL